MRFSPVIQRKFVFAFAAIGNIWATTACFFEFIFRARLTLVRIALRLYLWSTYLFLINIKNIIQWQLTDIDSRTVVMRLNERVNAQLWPTFCFLLLLLYVCINLKTDKHCPISKAISIWYRMCGQWRPGEPYVFCETSNGIRLWPLCVYEN